MIARNHPSAGERRHYRRMTTARVGHSAGRPLDVGIVLHDFALGGTERIAVRLANAWSDAGANVTIFCGSVEGPLAALLGSEVEVVGASLPIARGRGSRRRLAQAAAAHWNMHPVDALYVPGNFHWPVVAATAALPEAVRPAIVAQVSASLNKPQRGRIRQFGFDRRMRHMLKGADAIAALFDQARDDADRIAQGDRACTIALPALADDVPPPVGPATGKTIVAAGRFVPEKGFADLIDAFALIDDAEANLVIVGAGAERANLISRAKARGIEDRLVLPGYVADIRPWLDDARLFVLSSHFEGYPAVLVEALAAGRPVVATRCTSAVGTLIDCPDAGSIVPVGDPKAMACAIDTQLAAPSPDPLALAARVAHHRIGPVADAYLRLFEQAAIARLIAA